MLEADGGGAATQAAYDVWGSGVIGGAIVGTVASTGSGGFEFPSIEEMNAVLQMWQDRQASILTKRSQIVRAQNSLANLADDGASQSYLSQARDSLQLLYNQHDSMLAFVNNYIQKLTDAKNAKKTNEENNEQTLASSTGDSGA